MYYMLDQKVLFSYMNTSIIFHWHNSQELQIPNEPNQVTVFQKEFKRLLLSTFHLHNLYFTMNGYWEVL